MKKLNKGFVMPMLLAFVALLAIGGLVYEYKKHNPSVPKDDSSKQIDSSDWKTYTDTQYGFSIQYPVGTIINDSRLDSNAKSISFTLPTSSFAASASSSKPLDVFYVYVATQAWYNLGTPSGIFRSPANCEDFSSITVSFVTTAVSVATSSVNINGVNFVKGDVSEASTAQRSNGTEYCTLIGKMAYKLTPSVQYGHDYSSNGESHGGFNPVIDVNKDPVLNQMLSTFKFIATSTPVTSDWKTYSNTQYGFEFRYPTYLGTSTDSVGQTKKIDCNSKGYTEVSITSFTYLDIGLACPSAVNADPSRGTKQDIVVAGKHSTYFDYTSATSYHNTEVYIPLNNNLYVSLSHSCKSGQSACEELSPEDFKTILTTFTFTK